MWVLGKTFVAIGGFALAAAAAAERPRFATELPLIYQVIQISGEAGAN